MLVTRSPSVCATLKIPARSSYLVICLRSCSGGFVSPASRLDAGSALGHERCSTYNWQCFLSFVHVNAQRFGFPCVRAGFDGNLIYVSVCIHQCACPQLWHSRCHGTALSERHAHNAIQYILDCITGHNIGSFLSLPCVLLPYYSLRLCIHINIHNCTGKPKRVVGRLSLQLHALCSPSVTLKSKLLWLGFLHYDRGTCTSTCPHRHPFDPGGFLRALMGV